MDSLLAGIAADVFAAARAAVDGSVADRWDAAKPARAGEKTKQVTAG